MVQFMTFYEYINLRWLINQWICLIKPKKRKNGK